MNTIKLLDGGMGTLLRDKFNNKDQTLWSLNPYFHNKNDINNAHKLFLDNGSDIIITNNYCATPYYLKKKYNLDKINISTIISDLGKIAYDLVQNYKNKAVFGSIPPYGESYNYNINVEKNEIIAHYETTFNSLYKYVDSFLCETIASLVELNLLLELFNSNKELYYSKPIFFSFCVKYNGEKLLDNTDLSYVVNLLKKNGIRTLFFNCSPINYIDLAIKYINSLDKTIRIGVYPNKHEQTIKNLDLEKIVVNDINYKDIHLDDFLDYCQNWINNYNVKFIGGCCGIDESYIDYVSKKLTTIDKKNSCYKPLYTSN